MANQMLQICPSMEEFEEWKKKTRPDELAGVSWVESATTMHENAAIYMPKTEGVNSMQPLAVLDDMNGGSWILATYSGQLQFVHISKESKTNHQNTPNASVAIPENLSITLGNLAGLNSPLPIGNGGTGVTGVQSTSTFTRNTTNTTAATLTARRWGKVCQINLSVTPKNNITVTAAGNITDTPLGTMPEGWRPAINAFWRVASGRAKGTINTAGAVTWTAGDATGASYTISGGTAFVLSSVYLLP